jgi:predicted acylesterase/phospholipase RssA/CRP-like cAMP-binding protein
LTVDIALLAGSPLFAGLAEPELEEIVRSGRPRSFAPGEELCRSGEECEYCWLITGGLVDVLGPSGESDAGEVVGRLRKGSMVGEVAVILDEPYSETVIASIPTAALEFSATQLSELVQRVPQMVVNLVRGLHGRLAHAHARRVERDMGESVALVVGASLRRSVPELIAAAKRASPRPVTSLDRQFSFAGAVTAADELVTSHGTVLLPVELDAETVATLLREADRVVAVAATAREIAELGLLESAIQGQVEVVLVGDEAIRASRAWPADAPLRVVRRCESDGGLKLADADLAWVGRHLAGTKIGLALGAGGARGYAHVGVLQVLEEAGYVIDYVAGSSIGAIVGTHLALGADAATIDATLREMFDPPNVAAMFKMSLSGRSAGLELMTRLLRETTAEKTFADTLIPLTIMSVSLTARAPAPLRDGPLWEALLAATALAGMFPPHERDGQRLVDGLALVPVPTGAVVEAGADVTVSVNLLSAKTLPNWPGAAPPEPPAERRRHGVLDDLLEVMDLSQLSESVRHAELADVPITPRFGPNEWRDFHLADQFLAAGRKAAEDQLGALRSLARPAVIANHTQTEGGSVERADAVRL